MKNIVTNTYEITFDESVKDWLCADNIALALHAYCKNTKFDVKQIYPKNSESQKVLYNLIDDLRKKILSAMNEIGVPGEGYTQNIANAYEILQDAL